MPMSTILITLQVFLVLILVLLVFMQKSSDEGVANLTSGGNNFGKKRVMSIVGKFTIFIAVSFMINSLLLAKVGKMEFEKGKSILDEIGRKGVKSAKVVGKSDKAVHSEIKSGSSDALSHVTHESGRASEKQKIGDGGNHSVDKGATDRAS